MHFHRVVARLCVVEDLVVDAHGAVGLAGALANDNVEDVRRTAEEQRIIPHSSQRRILLDTPTNVHSTVASASDHDDVISGAARLERFAGAKFHVFSVCKYVSKSAILCYRLLFILFRRCKILAHHLRSKLNK